MTKLINPLDISKKGCGPEFKIKDHTEIINSDWDLKKKMSFKDLMFYKSFVSRIDGAEWNKTEYYHYILDGINNSKFRWRCRSKEDVIKRCKGLDNIYRDIKVNGYKDINEIDRIGINIARDGQILFNNGRHRLTFAQLLKIPKIPININVIHPEWIKFIKEIENYAESRKGHVYTDLIHPTLQHIPFHNGNERLNIIKNYLPKNSSILDIGAHFGYMDHKLEELGYQCSAIENNPEYLYVLNKLKIAMNRKFKVIKDSVFNVENLGYDCILALNIFHHFIKKEYIFKKFIKLLNRIDCDVLIFQSHNPKENQMINAYKNFAPQEFIEFIGNHSCLNYYQEIGRIGNRIIYKLTRNV